MTDEEINIAIAEACGWVWRVGIYLNCRGLFHPSDDYLKGHECSELQIKLLPISDDCASRVPRYTTDLNAMHGAWIKLCSEGIHQRARFYCELKDIVDKSLSGQSVGISDYCNATASQRAEALLRTLGKWKDEQ